MRVSRNRVMMHGMTSSTVVHFAFLGPVALCPAGDSLPTALEPVTDDVAAVTCTACLDDPLLPHIRAAAARATAGR